MSTPRPANRSYSTEALEYWFEALPAEWEKLFKSKDLTKGRGFYTDGLVRSVELKVQTGEVVTKTESQTVRAVIELKEGKIEWRTSLPEEENGAPFAIAAIYEIEELLADEIKAIDDSVIAPEPTATIEPEKKIPVHEPV